MKQYLVLGLGNDKEELRFTYHNLGFLVLDSLAKEFKRDWEERPDLKSYLCSLKIGRKRVLLAKPKTLMNNSGKALEKLIESFGFLPEEIVIVRDDHDLGWGQVKISKNKGSGGHKGVSSLIKILGTKNFVQIRIGIRQGSKKRAEDVVLQKLPEGEKTQRLIMVASRIIKELFERGLGFVMSEYNNNKKPLWDR